MAKQGFVSNEMVAGRLSSHGKITSLAQELVFEVPVTIMIVTKAKITGSLIAPDTNQHLLVDLKLYQDDVSSDFPCPLGQWTEALVKSIAANAIELATYDVYWSAGDYVQQSEE